MTASRRCAFAVVRRVFEDGSYADRAFRAEAERLGLQGRDRAFAMRLAYGTVQRRMTLDWLIARLSGRPPERLDPPVLAALRTGLYQLLFMDGVPDHAAVTESVDLAKRDGGAGFRLVNAVLRRATREAAPLLAEISDATPAAAALKHSHPEWIAELWWEALGEHEARRLMAQDNEPPENAARANRLRTTTAEVIDELARAGVHAGQDPLLEEALILRDPFDLHASELFERGLVMPQSRGSMLVARVAAPRPGDRVLDLCAAPGGKTTHLAALMGNEGAVIAIEADRRRAAELERNCRRLGADCVEVVHGNAAEPSHGRDFDVVLVDPPCSDLGTLQSRPDARWRKDPAQVAELVGLQRRILAAGAAALRPGGRMVYSTCTIDPAENEALVTDLTQEDRSFRSSDLSDAYPEFARGVFLQTLPHRDGTDGFFVASLERKL
jgi:16S rRNA (cytosine967-C5)-methyltransferase